MRQANGKALIRTPPKGETGRMWLILKLQSLLRVEFTEGSLLIDPNDLADGDRGCGAAKRAAAKTKAKPANGQTHNRPITLQRVLTSLSATKLVAVTLQ